MTIKPALGALPAGTAAPAHEDAYADSGTSPPKGKPLPEGYVRWATASHILPTGYKCWSNDSVAQGSQQNLDTDVIRLPRTTGTLQTFLVEHPELHPALCKCPIDAQIGIDKYSTLNIREAAKGLVSKQVLCGLPVSGKLRKVNLLLGEEHARK